MSVERSDQRPAAAPSGPVAAPRPPPLVRCTTCPATHHPAAMRGGRCPMCVSCDVMIGLLTEGRNRIAEPEHWCQRTHARDKGGEHCAPLDKGAARWCATGTIRAASGFEEDAQGGAIALLYDALPEDFQESGDLNSFNDDEGTTHADVLALYDRAIQQVREFGL